LFLKANPHRSEADAEQAGHTRLISLYPMPRLRGVRRVWRWTVLFYDPWPYLGHNSGLLLDEITHADLRGDTSRLDHCLAAVCGHCQRVIACTLRRAANGETIGKLYGDRAAAGGRLDQYYQRNTPWPITTGTHVRPSDLASLRLVINGQEHKVIFADVMSKLRVHFAKQNPIWAAITQGDPTDMNIGWSPAGGPVWFD